MYLTTYPLAHPPYPCFLPHPLASHPLSYKAMDLALPAEMVEGIEAFKEFYEGETKHRKLTWVYTQGTCVLKGNFKARAIEMVLSTLQVGQGRGARM